MPNFIHSHLMRVIRDEIFKKKDALNYSGFIYLDEPMCIDNYSEFCDKKTIFIDRINLSPYEVDEASPLTWYLIKGKDLLRIFKVLKENKFHIYRNIDGEKKVIRL